MFTDTINCALSTLNNLYIQEELIVGNRIVFYGPSWSSSRAEDDRTYSEIYVYSFNSQIKTSNMKVTLAIGGAVDDALEIFFNDNYLGRHGGYFNKCGDYENIWCSPIQSPFVFNVTNYAKQGNNQIKLRAYSSGWINWLIINSFKVTYEYYSK